MAGEAGGRAVTALLAAALVFVAIAPASPRVRGRAGHAPQLASAVTDRLSALARLRTRRPDDAETVPQALELVARALRAGASLLTALEAVAEELPEAGLIEVARRVAAGLSLRDALDHWAGDSRQRHTAAALLVLGHSSGAAMASSLDRAAASLRQRRAVTEEIRALTAQARASGAVVAAAPAGFTLIIAIVDHDALSVLFTTPVGVVSLSVGLLLEGVGIWWTGRLSRGVARWA